MSELPSCLMWIHNIPKDLERALKEAETIFSKDPKREAPWRAVRMDVAGPSLCYDNTPDAARSFVGPTASLIMGVLSGLLTSLPWALDPEMNGGMRDYALTTSTLQHTLDGLRRLEKGYTGCLWWPALTTKRSIHILQEVVDNGGVLTDALTLRYKRGEGRYGGSTELVDEFVSVLSDPKCKDQRHLPVSKIHGRISELLYRALEDIRAGGRAVASYYFSDIRCLESVLGDCPQWPAAAIRELEETAEQLLADAPPN